MHPNDMRYAELKASATAPASAVRTDAPYPIRQTPSVGQDSSGVPMHNAVLAVEHQAGELVSRVIALDTMLSSLLGGHSPMMPPPGLGPDARDSSVLGRVGSAAEVLAYANRGFQASLDRLAAHLP